MTAARKFFFFRLQVTGYRLQVTSHKLQVTAARKFFFFLDPKRRGRVALRDVLASPILHEMLELRRTDISADELQHNW